MVHDDEQAQLDAEAIFSSDDEERGAKDCEEDHEEEEDHTGR